MLTETKEFHSATAIATGHIEVRVDAVIRDGAVEKSRTPHRHVLAPGEDLAGQDERVAAIAKATWPLPSVTAAFAQWQAEQRRIAEEQQRRDHEAAEAAERARRRKA